MSDGWLTDVDEASLKTALEPVMNPETGKGAFVCRDDVNALQWVRTSRGSSLKPDAVVWSTRPDEEGRGGVRDPNYFVMIRTLNEIVAQIPAANIAEVEPDMVEASWAGDLPQPAGGS